MHLYYPFTTLKKYQHRVGIVRNEANTDILTDKCKAYFLIVAVGLSSFQQKCV